MPAASPASPAGTAPNAARVTRTAPMASASSARLRAIAAFPVSAVMPQKTTSIAPRMPRVSGRSAPSPARGESSRVAPTAAAVVPDRSIRSLLVSSWSGSRPMPARSNAASSRTRSAGSASGPAFFTRLISLRFSERKNWPRDRAFAPSVASASIAASRAVRSSGSTFSWTASANRCASAGMAVGRSPGATPATSKQPVSSAFAVVASSCRAASPGDGVTRRRARGRAR